MKNLKIKDILKVTNGELIVGNEEYECIEYSKDTRTIKKDDCYIGIKGEKFDGNLFWEKALENGASTVIVENVDFSKENLIKWENKNIIKVENSLDALYQIARLKRDLNKIPVVAITGSVGKTSTKDIIANVVSKKYKTLKTIGNNNNNIGMPLTILRLKDEEVMVLEMGMNHLGEIHLLSKIAKPNICVITNIGTSHIGNLGSRENILKAKLEILDGAENPIVVINNDDDLLHKWYEENKEKYNIITYGINNKSTYNAKDLILKEEESKFNCNIDGKTINFNVPVGGEHFILNSLSAIAVAKALKIEDEKIASGIEDFKLTKNRMDITELESGIKIINGAYNASFEAVQATLKNLSSFKENRKIAVLGDMYELGDFSKELHEKVGIEAYNDKIDILICSGKFAKYIIEGAKSKGFNENKLYFLENKEDILALLKKIAKKGDVILFKASNLTKFYEIAEKAKEELK